MGGEDASGQIGREHGNPEKYDKIIGPYTLRSKPKKGDGVQLAQICHKSHMIPMNTWKRPKLTNKEKGVINKSKTPEQALREARQN